jgi:hypothetical protein
VVFDELDFTSDLQLNFSFSDAPPLNGQLTPIGFLEQVNLFCHFCIEKYSIETTFVA